MNNRFRLIAAIAASCLCAWGGPAIAKSADPGPTGFTEADKVAQQVDERLRGGTQFRLQHEVIALVIHAARQSQQELVELARTLMQRGDIRADGQVEDDELVD